MIPIWWCLKPEERVLLKKYQQDTYGYHLEIPPEPLRIQIDTVLEDLDEIGKIIRRKPRHTRRVK